VGAVVVSVARSSGYQLAFSTDENNTRLGCFSGHHHKRFESEQLKESMLAVVPGQVGCGALELHCEQQGLWLGPCFIVGEGTRRFCKLLIQQHLRNISRPYRPHKNNQFECIAQRFYTVPYSITGEAQL